MKKTYYFLIVLISLSFITNAQNKEEDTIKSIMERFTKGMLDGDEKILNALTAAELTYGHSSGLLEDKAAFVKAMSTGAVDFTSIDNTKQTINIVEDIALVRHELHGEVNGNDIALGVLLVWKKENKSWKLLARQAYKL